MADELPSLQFLTPDHWTDYELLDSGGGAKLERFGPYRFVRPEPQAYWSRGRSETDWSKADGVFIPGNDEESGGWEFQQAVPTRWEMRYRDLRFHAQATAFRHMGVFPEQAVHWDWATKLIRNVPGARVLNLFGYTGLFSLIAASAGAAVTHVDASKKILSWGRENQTFAGLNDKPIRWLLDDAMKFVRREVRRGSRYDGIIIDPPKFGRGPKGEVWKLDESLPELLGECGKLLNDRPLFTVLSCYAIRASAMSLYFALREMIGKRSGRLSAGEVGVSESRVGGRALSLALFARWQSE